MNKKTKTAFLLIGFIFLGMLFFSLGIEKGRYDAKGAYKQNLVNKIREKEETRAETHIVSPDVKGHGLYTENDLGYCKVGYYYQVDLNNDGEEEIVEVAEPYKFFTNVPDSVWGDDTGAVIRILNSNGDAVYLSDLPRYQPVLNVIIEDINGDNLKEIVIWVGETEDQDARVCTYWWKDKTYKLMERAGNISESDLILQGKPGKFGPFEYKGKTYIHSFSYKDAGAMALRGDLDEDGEDEVVISFVARRLNPEIGLPAVPDYLDRPFYQIYDKVGEEYKLVATMAGSDFYLGEISIEDFSKNGKKQVVTWGYGGAHCTYICIYQWLDGDYKLIFDNGSPCGIRLKADKEVPELWVGREQWDKEDWCYADGTEAWEVYAWDGNSFVYNQELSTSPQISEKQAAQNYETKMKEIGESLEFLDGDNNE